MSTEPVGRPVHEIKDKMDGTLPILRTTGRTIRSASVSTATRLLGYNPANGMWQATGIAIAHAPNIIDLRSPGAVQFDVYGRTIRRVSTQIASDVRESQSAIAPASEAHSSEDKEKAGRSDDLPSGVQYYHAGSSKEICEKRSQRKAFKKGFIAIWRFIRTPTGLFITLYGCNVIAWGAMLFFLLLKVGRMSEERKEVWIEIDSQILNGLFCLTSWGLAPWRIRDTYWLLMWRIGSGKRSQNGSCDETTSRKTLTGKSAPATKTWKMDFVVINMLLNSLFQIGMATFMWEYNRHTRPNFGVGLFIGLGCFSSLLAGILTWWEGRKVKLIEGPILQEATEVDENQMVAIALS
ncbi:hypothetical protein PENANT_c022G07220 [Penicillium antarcticum]|uniref:Uncharacterized protein n=1 Tax=Penicillium antarcticum TaxID=416450 RepID=A0A1V6PZ10_9EURO|nr:hypothetical protein PENANT_c022G07220 [Penicillium antarcticum]